MAPRVKKNIPVTTEAQKSAEKEFREITAVAKSDEVYNERKGLVLIAERLVGVAQKNFNKHKELITSAESELVFAQNRQNQGLDKMPNAPEVNENRALLKITGTKWRDSLQRIGVFIYYWLPKKLAETKTTQEYIQERQTEIGTLSDQLVSIKAELDNATKNLQKAKNQLNLNQFEQMLKEAQKTLKNTEKSTDTKKTSLLGSSEKLLLNLPQDIKDTEENKGVIIKRNVLSSIINFLREPNEETKEKLEQAATNFRDYNNKRNKEINTYIAKVVSNIAHSTEYSKASRKDILANIDACQELYGNQIDTQNNKSTIQNNRSLVDEKILSPPNQRQLR